MTKSKVVDFIFDVECLSTVPESLVTEISILAFSADPTDIPDFSDLIKQGKKFKLSIKDQKGKRHVMQSTLDWWKHQSEEARKNLKPSDEDITLNEAVDGFIDYIKSHPGFNKYESQLWCRGMSFDIPIFISMLQQRFSVKDTMLHEPIRFWNGRDVRTALEAITMTRGLTMVPLRNGILEGFVMHDSIHDCAKDVLMLKYAHRYAMGLEEIPVGDDIDPKTIKQRN